jgi:hypothetical protein
MNKEQKDLLGDIIHFLIDNDEERNFFDYIRDYPNEPCIEDHVFYKGMRLAEEVLEEPHFLAPGTKVIVDNPEEDDMWNQEFQGTVKAVKEPWKLYTIEDQDGDCFDVDLWKLTTNY